MATKRDKSRTAFGWRLYEARKAAGLSQTEALKRVEQYLGRPVSQTNLSGLERSGEGSTFVVAFAKAYGVSPYWLALGEGPMREPGLSVLAERLGREFDRQAADGNAAQLYALAAHALTVRLDQGPQESSPADASPIAPPVRVR